MELTSIILSAAMLGNFDKSHEATTRNTYSYSEAERHSDLRNSPHPKGFRLFSIITAFLVVIVVFNYIFLLAPCADMKIAKNAGGVYY